MKIKQQKYTMTQINEFGEYYKNGHTLKETANSFNIKYETLANLLVKFKFRKKSKVYTFIDKYKNYFEEINSSNKAYFLGLLLADGCIMTTTYRKQCSISLIKSDSYILEKFIKELEMDVYVRYYKNSGKIVLNSDKIYEDLSKLGFKENKSVLDFSIPSIPKELMSHFIRGYFDGDGCITIKTSGYSVVSFCCNSKLFLEELQQELLNNGIITRPITSSKRKNNLLYTLYLSKRKNQLKFKEFIYKNADAFLQRKFDKFLLIPC